MNMKELGTSSLKFYLQREVFSHLKPWPNRLASFGLVFNLHFVWPPTCDDLHGLVLTLVELKFGCK